jgi:carbonic anhydrase
MISDKLAPAPTGSFPLVLAAVLLALAWLLAPAPRALAGGGRETGNPHTVQSALADLRAGNARFAESRPEHRNQGKERLARLAADGQTPLAAVLACSDSRVPVEELFDMGFGDLFVVRAAGAVPGADQLGSLEYAVAHLGVPVILVLTHTGCGAVSAAVSGDEEPGALGQLLAKIEPAARAVREIDPSRRVRAAVELSAVMFREQLPLLSPVLKRALDSGSLAIISGVYDIATGAVALDVPSGAAPADAR